MQDREEVTFDLSQSFRFVDLEGDEAIIAEPQVIQERYRAAVLRHQAALREGVAQCQVDYHEVLTDEDYEQALVRFLTQRLGMQG